MVADRPGRSLIPDRRSRNPIPEQRSGLRRALGSAAGTNDYALTIVATDDDRDPVSQQLEVTVTLIDVNEEPISIPVPLVELTAGNLPTILDVSEFFTDTDGDSLTYTLGDDAESSVASAVVEAGTMSITPLEEGTVSFLVTATDAAGLSVTRAIDVSVVSPPPPEPTPTPTPTPPHQHPCLRLYPPPRQLPRLHPRPPLDRCPCLAGCPPPRRLQCLHRLTLLSGRHHPLSH